METIIFKPAGRFIRLKAQANLIQSWLPSDWKIKPAFGTEAFKQLAEQISMLLEVCIGPCSAIYRTDSDPMPEPPIWESAQIEKHPTLRTEHRSPSSKVCSIPGALFLAFTAAFCHMTIGRIRAAAGFRWEMGITDHTLYAGWKVKNQSHRMRSFGRAGLRPH